MRGKNNSRLLTTHFERKNNEIIFAKFRNRLLPTYSNLPEKKTNNINMHASRDKYKPAQRNSEITHKTWKPA